MTTRSRTPSPYRTSYGARFDPSQNYGLEDNESPADFIGGMPNAISNPDPSAPIQPPAQSSFVAGMPQGQPPQNQPVQQSGNAVQRWQSGRTARYRVDMGLVDAHAPQSPLDTTPSGLNATAGISGDFTPQAQWNAGFTRQIQIPKAQAPAGGFSWSSWYPTAGGNPNAPSLPVNPIPPEPSRPNYNPDLSTPVPALASAAT